MDERIRKAFLIYLKGFLMGCADSVPGVSGGTIALITGIYERMVSAITSLHPEKIFRTLRPASEKSKSSRRDILFLSVLGSGVFTAILLTLNVVHFMISNHLVATYSFFTGLILSSILTLKDDITIDSLKRKTMLLAGFLVAFLLSGFSTLVVNHSTPVIFISGAIAVTAMVLPGISGSLMLLILGQYEYATGLVSDFTESISVLLTTGDISPVLQSIRPLAIFVTGGVIGLFTAAKTVEKALERDQATTITFLVGMVIGSLRAPLIRITQHLSSEGISWVGVVPEALLASITGAAVIIILNEVS